MNLNWFKNPDNVVYADAGEFIGNFSRETGIENLKEKIAEFELNPVKEGVVLKGRKRTSVRMFIPDLYFDEHIDMGENVWLYMGENYECYCLYNTDVEDGLDKNYKFFSHCACEYFPCHQTDNTEEFNCMFCYCPLYEMGKDCGGNYFYLDNGVKDCSGCLVPHRKDNYDYVIKKLMRYRKAHSQKEKEN
ncbi:MAG: cysteine-rich small domain-containing protein [Emergencia sp.]